MAGWILKVNRSARTLSASGLPRGSPWMAGQTLLTILSLTGSRKGRCSAPISAFFYPPTFLVVCLPLALAPYFWSLGLWLSATGYAYYRVVRGYVPSLRLAPFLAYPAVLLNAAHGQNGFLSAALLGAACWSWTAGRSWPGPASAP